MVQEGRLTVHNLCHAVAGRWQQMEQGCRDGDEVPAVGVTSRGSPTRDGVPVTTAGAGEEEQERASLGGWPQEKSGCKADGNKLGQGSGTSAPAWSQQHRSRSAQQDLRWLWEWRGKPASDRALGTAAANSKHAKGLAHAEDSGPSSFSFSPWLSPPWLSFITLLPIHILHEVFWQFMPRSLKTFH